MKSVTKLGALILGIVCTVATPSIAQQVTIDGKKINCISYPNNHNNFFSEKMDRDKISEIMLVPSNIYLLMFSKMNFNSITKNKNIKDSYFKDNQYWEYHKIRISKIIKNYNNSIKYLDQVYADASGNANHLYEFVKELLKSGIVDDAYGELQAHSFSYSINNYFWCEFAARQQKEIKKLQDRLKK